jgi:dihydroorotate dehydrogenase (NAD+) catalytic subunit
MPEERPAHSHAPWGRRLCETVENRASGGYRVFSLRDENGPEPLPGQFYMLATERRWEESGERPFLPRALSVADASPLTSPASADGAAGDESGGWRLDFLVDPVGPGSKRLCELDLGECVWVNGPLGNSFSEPRDLNPGAAGAVLVGGGVGIAPLALLRRRFAARNVPVRTLLGFRDEAHSGGLDDLFACCEARLASEDGHAGHRGYVTDLLATLLEGDDSASAAVYACGPTPMLDAVAALCGEHGVSCELAMEAPMACGYGACFGCAVPKAGGGYLRLCVDGPVVRGSGDGGIRPLAGFFAGRGPGCREGGRGEKQDAAAPADTPATAPSRTLPAKAPGPVGGAVGGPAPEEASATAGGGGSPAATGPAGAGAARFCGMELRHRVINGSGTFDAIAARRVYGDTLLRDFPFSAFVSKTITLEPRAGNPPQRIWETPAGMINSIGLPNRGLEGFLSDDLPALAELPVPLIVSVMGTSPAEFTRLVERVAAAEPVAAIELNVSCPNVESGLIIGEQPQEVSELLAALRPLTETPLIVKLTPNVPDPAAVAVAAQGAGADAVSLINTIKASAIDPATGMPGIAAGHGGLSGPAVRPIAVAQVRAVAAALRLPIVAMGGVAEPDDAFELIAAGATLVAVGTESFRDPRAGQRIAMGLAERL